MDDPRKKKELTDQQIIDGDIEKPISDFYDVYDTDLARDNLENDIPAADLEDI